MLLTCRTMHSWMASCPPNGTKNNVDKRTSRGKVNFLICDIRVMSRKSPSFPQEKKQQCDLEVDRSFLFTNNLTLITWFSRLWPVCVLSCFSHVQLFVNPWTVVCQAPLSMGFSRQEYWNGLPYPPPGDLPGPGINPHLLHCRQILYQWATREALLCHRYYSNPYCKKEALASDGLVVRIWCFHHHDPASISGWEPKPPFKLLQA